MTKTEKILNHLLAGNSISQREAAEKFNAWRLGDICFKLRTRGYDIKTIDEKHEGGIHARYILHPTDTSPDGSGTYPAPLPPAFKEGNREAEKLFA